MSAIQDRIHEILEAANAFCCVECGKCSAVCPMPDMYSADTAETSPRAFLKSARDGDGILFHGRLWCCTECGACTEICPEGVQCLDVIRGLKSAAVDAGHRVDVVACRRCGRGFTGGPVQAYLKTRFVRGIPRYLDLCPDCRRREYVLHNA